jgi:hypothetical protein
MKKLLLIVLSFTFIFLSCTTDSSDDQPDIADCDNGTVTGMITLETQQEVNDFGALCYTKIDGTLNIIDLETTSDKITDLTPLSNLNEIYTLTYPDSLYGTLRIQTSLLSNLQGLNNIKKVSRVIIEANESLESLEGLEGLESIDQESSYLMLNELFILNNLSLENLDGLNNLSHVGQNGYYSRIWISNNPQLENIDGFESLTRVGTPTSPDSDFNSLGFRIVYNNALQHVNGLSNLMEMYVPLNFFSSSDLQPSTPVGNNSLTDFCGLQNLLTNGVHQSVRTYAGTSYEGFSVTNQDIIDGNCSQ